MEFSKVNFEVKTNFNDTSPKTTAAKDNENSFSKVYKDVNDKTYNDTLQNKTDALKYSEDSISKDADTLNSSKALDEDVKLDKTKDDKDLNNLVQLLLLSQGNNQNLINLLNFGGSISTMELQDMISKILKENLEANNSLNLMQSSNGNPTIDEILKMLMLNSNSKDEGLNKFSINQGAVSDTVDKLSAVIANKLVSDNTLRENIMSELMENTKVPSITTSDSNLKGLIVKQLKIIELSGATTSENKALSKDNISTVSVLKDNIFAATLNSKNSTAENESYTETSNLQRNESKNTIAANKLIDSSLDKEDKLLKQLTENNNSKDTKDNVSDKIANALNRFETFKVDNQQATEAKFNINKATLNEDFIKTVKFMDLNNLKELSVKIIPKDLGEVVIRLSMENGVMKANITASNKDTYNLLNSQLPVINSELAKQNMSIQNFSLSLYNGDNFLFSGDGSSSENNKQQSRNNIKVDNLEEDLQKENYIEDNNTVNLLA